MQLKSFRIQNFRSIKDSGDIDVARITTLLGRNESGKSNLLLGLQTLNPTDGFDELDATKNFPRHRRLTECTPTTPVVSSRWKLTDDECAQLTKQLPNATEVTHLTIGRPYGNTRWIVFEGLTDISFDIDSLKTKVSAVVEVIKTAAGELDFEKETALNAALEQFEKAATVFSNREKWASGFTAAQGPLNGALKAAGISMPDDATEDMESLAQSARDLGSYDVTEKKARDWVAKDLLPIFIFVDEYPELDGHQNIDRYLDHKGKSALTEAERNFEKLCKVADLDPSHLQKLEHGGKHEERNLLANRASAVVTSELRRLWKDRQLKVRFNLDAHHFETSDIGPHASLRC